MTGRSTTDATSGILRPETQGQPRATSTEAFIAISIGSEPAQQPLSGAVAVAASQGRLSPPFTSQDRPEEAAALCSPLTTGVGVALARRLAVDE